MKVPARCSWEIFGSTVVLQVAIPRSLAACERAARRELEAIDRACSRFKGDSELSAVNASAGEPRRISALLMEAIGVSLLAAGQTGGTVDPTIGRCLEVAGYDRDWASIAREEGRQPLSPPSEATPLTLRRVAGWRGVRVDRHTNTVRVPRGVSLDLGAVAKAWAADRAAAAAFRAGAGTALVAVGGDLAIAGATRDPGWLVRVTDDHRGRVDAAGQTVAVAAGAIATSSTAVRRWRRAGREMHHIIDPQTGLPARSRWRTVSVAAASCAEANTAATAALIMSSSAASWLAQRRLPARLVAHDGSVSYVAGWPEQEHG